MYADQLDLWLKYFQPDQFFFLHIADLKVDTLREKLKELGDFLGIDSSFQYAREVLQEQMNAGGNGFNLNTMARHKDYKVCEPMGEEIRQRLYKYFKPHNDVFFKRIGRDLHWDLVD